MPTYKKKLHVFYKLRGQLKPVLSLSLFFRLIPVYSLLLFYSRAFSHLHIELIFLSVMNPAKPILNIDSHLQMEREILEVSVHC